jgi:NodT family efflux transporter outer membrane factor (OMF) lipoprotein
MIAGATLLLGGCKVGPDFVAPAPPPPAAGYGTAPARAILGEGEIGGPGGRWWQAFGSPQIDVLVDQALANNQSLAESRATLERARARIAEVAGRRLPQVDANARVEHEKFNLQTFGFDPSTLGGGGFGNPEIDLYTLGGGVSWDLDLFGKNARGLEQARADTEAQAHQTAAAHLTIAGRVVIQALTIAAINARIDAVHKLIDGSGNNVRLTDARRRGGEGTLVEVLSAQSQLAEDRALLPALDQSRTEARNMLAVLVGVSPAELGPTDFSLAKLTLPAQVPVALPSVLVRRRPDILAAEAQLHSATAAVGMATAELYPDVSIGASVTQATRHIDSLFSPNYRAFDIFGGLTAPIFHGGTLKARKRGAEAAARAAAAHYKQTVLESFGQVANLLAALDNDARAVAATREAANIADRSLVLSRKSYQIGNTGVLQVIEASHASERAVLAQADALGQQALDIARLMVATAGGWTAPTDAPPATTPPPR